MIRKIFFFTSTLDIKINRFTFGKEQHQKISRCLNNQDETGIPASVIFQKIINKFTY